MSHHVARCIGVASETPWDSIVQQLAPKGGAAVGPLLERVNQVRTVR